MLIGIQPDKIGSESYSDKWAKFLQDKDVNVKWIDLRRDDALDQVKNCDGVMWRWAHNPQDKQTAQRILYTIEQYLGIPVYPDSRTAWHYDEKISQFYLLQAMGAPIPQTWLFWDQDHALEWAQSVRYPVVFKLSTGAGSSNVLKIDNKIEAINLINRSFEHGIFPYTMNEFKNSDFPHNKVQMRNIIHRFKDSMQYLWHSNYPQLHSVWWKPEYGYTYFQEFLPDNLFDTRVTIIGDRAFGFRRINRKDDFRASGSGKIEYDPDLIDFKCVEIAFKLSYQGEFQSMAYDFLYSRGKPVINEISYAYADWAIYNCPGHWNRDMEWIDGQMWPEEAQVNDFVSKIKSRKY